VWLVHEFIAQSAEIVGSPKVLPYKCLNSNFIQATVTFFYILPNLPQRMIPNADDPDSVTSTGCH